MSGHSHWSTIKHKKGAADIQRGKIFSKIARLITIAAREGGDPEINSKLRLAIEKAREVNMPSSNIERAIKRGTGEDAEGQLQEILIEAYGPGNIAIMIEGITDNKNRAIAEIKHILNNHNGKLVPEGSVKWLFEQKGVVVINTKEQDENFQNKETLELKIIDLGAEDLIWKNEELQVYLKLEDLQKTKNKLIEQEIKVDSANLEWVPKKEILISEQEKETAEKLFEALDENDDVQEIYSNYKE